MNDRSSRAHTVFALRYEKNDGQDIDTAMSKVYFVDLAGRENEKTTLAKGDRLIELSFINRSLFHLSNAINSLAQAGGSGAKGKLDSSKMAIFRNSKLTLLLSQALSGNSKTNMIGTLSPSILNLDDNQATLRFAATVK